MKPLLVSQPAASVVTSSSAAGSGAPVETQHQPIEGTVSPQQSAPAQQSMQSTDGIDTSLPVSGAPVPGAVIAGASLFGEDRPEVTHPDSPSALEATYRQPLPTVYEVHRDLMVWFGDGEHRDKHLALALVHLAHGKTHALPSDAYLAPAIGAGMVNSQGKLLPGVAKLVTSCTRPIGEFDVHFQLPA